MNRDLVGMERWMRRHGSWPKTSHANDVIFGEVFERFGKRFAGRTFIEIGCVPGDFCVYFGKKFGCRITGLDYLPKRRFAEKMAECGIGEYSFIRHDFRGFKPAKKYGIVASFGFIEHFSDPEAIVGRHAQMVEQGGYLIISAPNFTRLQGLFHLIFDTENMMAHNQEAMDMERVEKWIKKRGFGIIYADYSRRSEFWMERPGHWWGYPSHLAGAAVLRALNAALRGVKSKYSSSHWLIIAKNNARGV